MLVVSQLKDLLLALFTIRGRGLAQADVNQLELTVLSSGVRLYISQCVVLHNDPQRRTLPQKRLQDGGGLQLALETFSPLSALQNVQKTPKDLDLSK